MNNHGIQYISDGAIIGSGGEIGPFSFIDEDVVIGNNCWIGPSVTILRGTRIGDDCKIFPGAVLGAIPQDLKYAGEDSLLIVGNHVTVREFCTLNRATRYSYHTIIEDHCLLMAYTHVAHDCIIREGAVLANNVNLAGHVELGAHCLLGGLVAVQQFVSVGAFTMIAGASLVRKNVPPFIRAAHEPLAYIGVNSIGLERKGFNEDRIQAIHDIYKIVFSPSITLEKRIQMIESDCPESIDKERIVQFILNSKNGIIRGRKVQMDCS